MSIKIDLHMHSTISDGTDSPAELLNRVKDAGISLFSLTDHDDVKGCEEIAAKRQEGDPAFINGVEFSCRDEGGKYHILGYAYQMDAEPIRALVKKAHGIRMDKLSQRLDFLREQFGFVFKKEDVDKLLGMPNPGKPHIGNLMVSYGYAKSRNEAISEFINKKKIKNRHLAPAEAIEAIRQSGGIPVLAHPSYGSGEELILGEEMEARVIKLKEMGLMGLEAFYSGFTDKLQSAILSLAEKYQLYVTAGSDYHGHNKLVQLLDTNLEDANDAPKAFWDFIEAVAPGVFP